MTPNTTKSKLHRSRTDSMIGGVCGGLAETLGMDATQVRLFFVLVALLGGASLVMYVILWLIMPLEGQGTPTTLEENVHSGASEISQRARSLGNEVNETFGGSANTGYLFIGGLLLLLGVLFLTQNLVGHWLPWLGFGTLWPLLLVIGGVMLIVRRAVGSGSTKGGTR